MDGLGNAVVFSNPYCISINNPKDSVLNACSMIHIPYLVARLWRLTQHHNLPAKLQFKLKFWRSCSSASKTSLSQLYSLKTKISTHLSCWNSLPLLHTTPVICNQLPAQELTIRDPLKPIQLQKFTVYHRNTELPTQTKPIDVVLFNDLYPYISYLALFRSSPHLTLLPDPQIGSSDPNRSLFTINRTSNPRPLYSTVSKAKFFISL